MKRALAAVSIMALAALAGPARALARAAAAEAARAAGGRGPAGRGREVGGAEVVHGRGTPRSGRPEGAILQRPVEGQGGRRQRLLRHLSGELPADEPQSGEVA